MRKARNIRVVDNNRRAKKFGIDHGKVIALRRAGWEVKDIAWDVGVEESDVIDTIEKYKRGEIKIQNEVKSYD